MARVGYMYRGGIFRLRDGAQGPRRGGVEDERESEEGRFGGSAACDRERTGGLEHRVPMAGT